jgi:hypothetical protein
MANQRKKFLGPNAGTLRDPTSNALEHGRVRNPPREMEMSNFRKGAMHKNEHKLASVAASVAS